MIYLVAPPISVQVLQEPVDARPPLEVLRGVEQDFAINEAAGCEIAVAAKCAQCQCLVALNLLRIRRRAYDDRLATGSELGATIQ